MPERKSKSLEFCFHVFMVFKKNKIKRAFVIVYRYSQFSEKYRLLRETIPNKQLYFVLRLECISCSEPTRDIC